ncbi:hypothetical protein NARC_160039 [Candidatus Nitrosocosmicus arcticus]|uniref:Uncharacterized protein n=2 Tax=Candidatus Nitrosocosmicus arcticus TaxID=2035267 RepID=A0A557SRU3_9ARCH|nr:hypothetical protein NARC_160039 [Candidatus Nitrosocosmicus arcticus]
MYIYDMISENNSNPTVMSLHSPYKKFSSIRAFVDVSGKTKYCVSCSNTATQEAIFTADGASIIEKYCDSCAKKEMK